MTFFLYYRPLGFRTGHLVGDVFMAPAQDNMSTDMPHFNRKLQSKQLQAEILIKYDIVYHNCIAEIE